MKFDRIVLQVNTHPLTESDFRLTPHFQDGGDDTVNIGRTVSKLEQTSPKLKVKMQSVSDDDVWKRFLEKPRFELAAKGVFRLGSSFFLACRDTFGQRWLSPLEKNGLWTSLAVTAPGTSRYQRRRSQISD